MAKYTDSNSRIFSAGDVASSGTTLADYLEVASGESILLGIDAYNTHTGVLYLQIHDAANIGAVDNTTLKMSYKVYADSNIGIGYTLFGTKFANGIVIAASSTKNTYTDAANDKFMFMATYI